jgi:hypothetical protein
VFAEETLETMPALGIGHASVRDAIETMLDLLPEARDPVRSERLFELIAGLGPGGRAPAVNAQVARAKARIAAAEGGDPADINRNFGAAAAIFEERGMRFWLAVTRLDWAEWLMGLGREDEALPLLEQAHAEFRRLRATPWLERSAALLPTELAAAAEAVT